MEKTGRKTLIVLEAVWFALLTVSAFFPLFFVFSYIPLLFLTALFYIKNLRINSLFLFVVMLVMCVVSRGDPAYVLSTVLFVSGLAGVLWGLKWRSYLAGAAISGLITIAFILLPLIIYSPLENKTPQQFLTSYAREKAAGDKVIFATDSQFASLSKTVYKVQKPDGLKKGEEGYDEARIEVFETVVWDWADENLYTSLTGIGAMFGIAAFIFSYLVFKHTPTLTLKSFNEFKVNTEPILFKDMRLTKKYFMTVFTPALAFYLVTLVQQFNSAYVVSLAVLRAFCIIPCAAASLTFVYHTVSRVRAAGFRLYLLAIWWMLMAFCVFFPFAAFLVSAIGLIDIFIPLRRLLDRLLKEGEFKSDKDGKEE